MKLSRIVMVLLVVVILIFAYFFFVGESKAVPNVGPVEDPTGQERQPIVYAVISTSIGLKNELNRFDGKIYSITVELNDYITGDPAQTYREKWTWDTLNGWIEDDVEIWVTMTITGPSNYISDVWESEHQKDTITEVKIDYDHYDFGPFRADFWDPGEYTVKVTVHVASDEYTGSPVYKMQTFTVAG